jgi:type III restriction enzyme
MEVTAKKEADDLFMWVLQESGIHQPHLPVMEAMRQSVLLLDHVVRTGMPEFGHAFQPLLHPLDEYALRIIDRQLSPCVTSGDSEREDYFSPYLEALPTKTRVLLERNGRYLKDNLIFGRSIMKLGTLLFCLRYAKEGDGEVSGVWKDVRENFSGSTIADLYCDLRRSGALRGRCHWL